MPTPTSNPIYGTQCAPVFGNTYEQCGGSFSRAQLSILTETQIKALFVGGPDGTQFHEVAHVLKHQFEMAMCGIKRNGFFEWITSSGKSGMSNLLNFEKRQAGPMLLRPFILGRQQSVVNTDYYRITNGYAANVYTARTTPGSGTGPLIASQLNGALRVIRVINGYGAGNLLDAGRFLSDMSTTVAGGHALFVLNTITGGVAATTQWRIVAAVNADDGTYVDVAIARSGIPVAPGMGANQDDAPVAGVVINGINNVADVEQYCKNPTNYTNTKFVPFWFQTYRETRCVDSEYLKVQKQLLGSNDYFQQFVDLPESERNRQDEERSQREFVHSFLFGRAYSVNQTVNNWGLLPDITSVAQGSTLNPGIGVKLIAKRANMIGVYDQLRACGQVYDLLGANLVMDTFLETYIYNVYRARQGRGSKFARNLVLWTDTTTANEWNAAWIKYSAKKTGIPFAQVGLNFNAADMDRNDPKAQLGFHWRTYQLFKPSGVTLEIVTHETFDDLRDMFATADVANPTRGKFLLLLDLGSGGSIHPATLASNRKVYTVGEIDNLARVDPTFSCVMEAPTQIKTLTSKTVTAIVNCPLENLWTENFDAIVVAP